MYNANSRVRIGSAVLAAVVALGAGIGIGIAVDGSSSSSRTVGAPGVTMTNGQSAPIACTDGSNLSVWPTDASNITASCGGSPTTTTTTQPTTTTTQPPTTTTQPPTTTTTAPSGSMAPPAGYTTAQKIEDDQFGGTTLDSYWTPEVAPGTRWTGSSSGKTVAAPYSSGGSNQAAYFGPAQATVNNGLTLTARKTTSSDPYSSEYAWVSGAVTSKAPLPSAGWYVQIKAEMPDTSNGMWPGLWFLPSSSAQEFDGFEGGFSKTNANEEIHSDLFSKTGQVQQVWSTGGINITTGYNTYGYQYQPGKSVTVYLNGKQVWQDANSNISTQAYYLLIELQVASSSTTGWHTGLSSSTPNPATMKVAEVQVYN